MANFPVSKEVDEKTKLLAFAYWLTDVSFKWAATRNPTGLRWALLNNFYTYREHYLKYKAELFPQSNSPNNPARNWEMLKIFETVLLVTEDVPPEMRKDIISNSTIAILAILCSNATIVLKKV